MKHACSRFRVLRPLRLSFCVLLFAATAARALVIDDFTQGALVQQATNFAGLTTVQTGLNPASVLGGTRSVYVGSLNRAEESIELGKGRFHFTANRDYGYFTLDWGSVTPLNVNLSAGGNNQFRFELVDSSPCFRRASSNCGSRAGTTGSTRTSSRMWRAR